MKKLNKGFTLVELIVVMALMVIIMSFVLNVLSPVNLFYKRVKNTTYQEADCITISNVIADNIKYSRSVLVSNGPASLGVNEVYKRCIVIDNTAVRPDSKQHGKCDIKTYDVSTSGALSNPRTLRGFDTHSDATFNITINDFCTADEQSYIKLDFKANPMKGTSGGYVVDNEIVYNYSKTIQFTNINLKDILSNPYGALSVNGLDASPTAPQDQIYIYYCPADQMPAATTVSYSIPAATT